MSDSSLDARKVVLRQKIIGVRIRHARIEAGLTHKEVGQAVGLSAAEISQLELGQRSVSLPQLEVMALLFGTPLTYFWSEDPIGDVSRKLPTVEAIALRQRIIGVLLRQARTEAGRSLEDVAALLNISVDQVASYELGQTEISVPHLEIMADDLNVSLDYFKDQGLPFENSGDHLALAEIASFSELPKEVREFLTNPANLLYINIAMRLSDLSAETLRNLAEGLLEVTY